MGLNEMNRREFLRRTGLAAAAAVAQTRPVTPPEQYFGFPIGEVSCPTKYFEEASSISFRRSVSYGLGVLATTAKFALQKAGLAHYPIFSERARKLDLGYYSDQAEEPQVLQARAAAK